MTGVIQIHVAVPDAETASLLSAVLLGSQLAACVQTIGPVISRYTWKGKIEESEEYICLIKAELYNYRDIETLILENHPYDVPEIIAVPVNIGYSKYIDWVKAQ